MSDTFDFDEKPAEVQPDQPAQPARVDTPHVRNLLRNRYPPGEWALMEEVAPKTGGGTRYADAIAVNLWSSRGHAVHGFEIKVSRSDWLRELKHPEKADELAGFCDYWWIVAPAGIVKDGELPPTWGYMEARSNGLFLKVSAPKLDAKPVTRAFFASLMRRGHEGLANQARWLVMREQAEASTRTEKLRQQYRDEVRRDVAKLEAKIAEFEEKTGLKFGSEWQGPPVSAVKLAQRLDKLSGYGGEPLGRLVTLAADLERAAAQLREAVAEPQVVQQ